MGRMEQSKEFHGIQRAAIESDGMTSSIRFMADRYDTIYYVEQWFGSYFRKFFLWLTQEQFAGNTKKPCGRTILILKTSRSSWIQTQDNLYNTNHSPFRASGLAEQFLNPDWIIPKTRIIPLRTTTDLHDSGKFDAGLQDEFLTNDLKQN